MDPFDYESLVPWLRGRSPRLLPELLVRWDRRMLFVDWPHALSIDQQNDAVRYHRLDGSVRGRGGTQ